ncbi:MAG: amino acid ABC transporter substrate-binding protein [Chloroflexi bacterium]|nr:amino acid ABC transporter substrate-binding protein [Chloroflexota bacterium]
MFRLGRVKWLGVVATIVALALTACGGPAATSAPTTSPTKPPAVPTAAPVGAATTAPTTAPAATKKLVIGYTASQTGAQNVASAKQVEGLKLWAADVTKAGGIKTKDAIYMPELKSYDDESKTDRVQALYTKLISDDKVDLLISPYSSTLVKAAAVVSEQNGKLMITAGGADDLTMEAGFKNIYQVYTPASRYLTGVVDMLKKLDPSVKKVAIVNEKDSFSTTVAAALLPYAKAQGYDVVLNESYDSNSTDFVPFINKLTPLAPEAILGGGHFQDGTTFAKQMKERNVSAKYVALLVAPPEPTFIEIGDAAQGIIGPSQWEPLVKFSAESAKAAGLAWYGPSVQQFMDGYQAAYKSEPSYHSAGGYAAGMMLQKAIEDAGSADPEKMKAALDKVDMLSFYGRVKFSVDAKTHGKQEGHGMVYMQWQKDAAGKLMRQIVWPLEAKSADVQPRK